MQQSSREMQGMASPLNGISPSAGVAAAAAQISLQDLHNGHRQHQIQNAGLQLPASHFEDHPSAVGGDAGGHDDFFDQMLSSLPSSWPDLGNPKSPWDLTSSSNPTGLAGKSPEESAAADGLHYAPYDESALLASRLQQHQINGGSSPAGKPMMLQLNHHHQQQQQQMLLQSMGRSPVVGGGGDSGLLPLPLSLGSGGSVDSRLLVDRSRDEVDPSFKSPNTTRGEGLYNGFGGPLQRAAQAATQQHFHNPQGASMPAQNFGGGPAAGMGRAPAAAAATSAGGGAAPPRQRVRARRGQATDPHSIAERVSLEEKN